MSETPIDLQLIGRQLERILDEQRTLRREMDDVRSLVIGLADQNRLIDRRLGDMQADLELMIKSEIGGACRMLKAIERAPAVVLKKFSSAWIPEASYRQRP